MSIGTTRLKKVLAAAETTGDMLNPEDKLWWQNHRVAFQIQQQYSCEPKRNYCRHQSLCYMIEILKGTVLVRHHTRMTVIRCYFGETFVPAN
jgi:hypothetical protein